MVALQATGYQEVLLCGPRRRVVWDNDLSSDSDIENFLQSSEDREFYKYAEKNDIDEAMERMKAIDEKTIENIAEICFRSIENLKTDLKDYNNFLDNEEYYTNLTIRIIKSRQEKLEELVESKVPSYLKKTYHRFSTCQHDIAK